MSDFFFFFYCRYPPSLTGTGFLSALYVPRIDTSEPGDSSDSGNQDGKTTPLSDRSRPIMTSLSDVALHELLLVYIARARRSDEQPATDNSKEANDVLVSMAQSDAVQTLLPLPPELTSSSDTRVCVIRNPRGPPAIRATKAGGRPVKQRVASSRSRRRLPVRRGTWPQERAP